MNLCIFGSAYSQPPGLYEESELDCHRRKRPVPPQRLRGNPEQVRAHFRRLQVRRPESKLYLSGVLTFTEPWSQIERIQTPIMDGFEEMMFAGVGPNRFLRLWYQHMDKGRPELHRCFLTQDLVSGRLASLYYRERDWGIRETWQELQNRIYGLTSPADPSLARLLKVSASSSLVSRPEAFAEVKSIIAAIDIRKLQSRNELCNQLVR